LKYEYLIFNIFVLSGPLFFGSFKKYYFLNHWRNALLIIFISAIPFIVWDVLVTNRHWFFAEEFTLGIRIFDLPIEEIMFFFTVPYACLFSWTMIKKFSFTNNSSENKEYHSAINSNNKRNSFYNKIVLIISIGLLVGSFFSMFNGKEYTALAALFFTFSILFDKVWGSKIFATKVFWIYFILVSFFTLIFNGYLTWRPIVTYDIIYQLDFRIFTIPIEDFFFGYALIIISTSLFEKKINITNS